MSQSPTDSSQAPPDTVERPTSTDTHSLGRHSFMKSVFQGHIEQELILPFPAPSKEEQETIEMVVGTVLEFGERHVDAGAFDRDKKLPRAVIEGLAELGVFGMIVPEESGGFGFSNTAYSRVIEALTQVDPSIACTVGAHQSIGLKGLLLFGSTEQKERYLSKLATGEMIAAFALTEPDAGSDAAGIQSSAKLNESGTHYVLNGTKQYITNGGIADFFTVFAKVVHEGSDEKGFTGFIVTRDMPGVSTTKEEDKLGIRASSTTQVILEDVQVPVENMIGREGLGFKLAMEILNTGRLGLGAGTVGACKQIAQQAMAYAAERKAWGNPINHYELIQKKISRMNAQLFGMESIVYLTTGLADKGGIDFSIESAICKVYCSESLWKTADEAMQIAGGAGYMCEFPYERYLRDARINLIFEGTNEILRLFIALAGMRNHGEYLKEIGRALHSPLSSMGVLSEYLFGKVKRTFVRPRFEGLRPEMEVAADLVAKYSDRLYDHTDEAIRTHKKEILQQQFVLERLANMAIQLYVLAASISRMEHLNQTYGSDQLAFEREMFDLLVGLSRQELEGEDARVARNLDDSHRLAAGKACEKGEHDAKLW